VRKELKAGIKAAFLQKKTRGATVKLQLRLHYGDEKSLQNKAIAAQVAMQMLVRGSSKHSYQDYNDERDQLKARMGISGDAAGATLNIETLRDKLPAALDLGLEMLTTPTFPEKEFELVKTDMISNLEQQLNDPQAVAAETLQQLASKWPKSDPRAPMTSAEQIAQLKTLKLADVKAYYKQFVGAGHGELVVVGDFEPQMVSDKVETAMAKWPSKAPYKRLENKAWGVAGVQKSIDIKDKENTVVIGTHDLSLRDTDADYPAWAILGQILGGGGGSRLWMRIREHEGLSYGVGAWTYAGSLDDAGGFGVYMIVAPANLAKAKASLLDEVGKMANGKVEADELAKAKDEWLKAIDTRLSNDNYEVQMLANELYRNRKAQFLMDQKKAVAAVTAADIERVAKKLLHPDKLVLVDAGDTAKAK